jgi:alkylated DNA repair dioxygenase AlkB
MGQEILFADQLFALTPPAVPGLRYLPDAITAADEAELIARIDAMPWSTDWKRRVQVYGVGYGRAAAPPPLPPWAAALGRRLHRDGLIEREPENAVVNEYPPGIGIAPHRDYAPFGPTVVGLSLGAWCVMDLIDPAGGRHSLALAPRSLLVLGGEARSRWKHGIAPRRSDVIGGVRVPRSRRLSLTFRTVVRSG